jgi:hypothetical protein
MKKLKVTKAIRAKAKQLARPLATDAKRLAKYKQSVMLRNEHLAIQDSVYRKNEYDKLSGHIHSSIHPGLHAELVRERSKLLT